MRHHGDPSILRSSPPGPEVWADAPDGPGRRPGRRPGPARSVLAAVTAVGAVALGAVALAAGGTGAPGALAPAAASGPSGDETSTTLPPGIPLTDPPPSVPGPQAPDSCNVTPGVLTTLPCPLVTTLPVGTSPAPTRPAPSATVQPTWPTGPVRPNPTPATPPPDPTAGDPTKPAGISVEVQLSSTTLVAGRPVQATVRIRNATSQAFPVLVGCGVTYAEVVDPTGNDATDRSGAEPCGTDGHYFSGSTVPAHGSLERVLPVAPTGTAAGPHQVRAAWARDTGAGLIHYIQAPPVAVSVTPPPAAPLPTPVG